MKLNTQKQNEFIWHAWFAWYPVKVPLFKSNEYLDVYKYQWVWLEKIERKYEFTFSGLWGQWAYKITK